MTWCTLSFYSQSIPLVIPHPAATTTTTTTLTRAIALGHIYFIIIYLFSSGLRHLSHRGISKSNESLTFAIHVYAASSRGPAQPMPVLLLRQIFKTCQKQFSYIPPDLRLCCSCTLHITFSEASFVASLINSKQSFVFFWLFPLVLFD